MNSSQDPVKRPPDAFPPASEARTTYNGPKVKRGPSRPRTKHESYDDDAAAAPLKNYETYPSPPHHFAFTFSNALF